MTSNSKFHLSKGLPSKKESFFIFNSRSLRFLALIALAILSRVLFFIPNANAVLGSSIHWSSNSKTASKTQGLLLAILFPTLVLLVSDLVFFELHSTLFFVYIPFAIWSAASYLLRTRLQGTLSLGTWSVSGSLFFWMISNLGVFFSAHLYPMNLDGLVTTYLMALPFLAPQMAGDLITVFGLRALSTYIPLNIVNTKI